MAGGDLGLDPENDPVIGTTENGLEIKYHDATTTTLTGNWSYSNFTSGKFVGSTVASGTFYNLSGYLYITMGTYGGSAVNWVIIGRNSSLTTMSLTNTYNQGNATLSEFIKFSSYSTYANYLNSQRETSTPAGSAINSDNSKQILNTITGVSRSYTYNISSYGAPVATTEIPSGCVLCICSKALYNSTFNTSTSSGNNYSGSNLQTQMTNLYSSGLGLTSAQKAQIQAQSLSTTWYGGTSSISGQYLFPLAGASSSESYYVETYLTSTTKRDIDAYWWLRSGYAAISNYATHVSMAGVVNYSYDDHNVTSSYGVRPAFVLKI